MNRALEIAEDFLARVATAKLDSAAKLVVKERRRPGPGGLASGELRDMLGADPSTYRFKPGDEFTSWKIHAKLLSPEKDEASFRGSLEGPKRTATFALLVRKDRADGEWRVGDFSVVIKIR
jgi:hypothetical protein